VRVKEAEMKSFRVLDAMQRGVVGIVEAAANKILNTVECRLIARDAMDFGGPEAVVHRARLELPWRQGSWETIGGGSSEVMRNAVATRRLGLAGGSWNPARDSVANAGLL